MFFSGLEFGCLLAACAEKKVYFEDSEIANKQFESFAETTKSTVGKGHLEQISFLAHAM